jgi:geranylgeranyl diphosphate synthase type 3
MDDVEDSSLLRRGSPTAHTVYGVPHTINTSGYVYFLAYQELFKLRPTPSPDADTTISSSSTSSGEAHEGSSAAGPEGKGKGKDTELDRLVTEEMLALHRGQGLEIFWRDSLTCPSEEEYIKMVRSCTFLCPLASRPISTDLSRSCLGYG